MFVDALQVEMHKKYDLRPRKKKLFKTVNLSLRSLAQVSSRIKPKKPVDIPKANEVLEPSKREKEIK
jgi:hypothetical protein